ncbi:MAG: sorbosone dehydrogenase family protein, partial [Nitrospirota bacterium]
MSRVTVQGFLSMIMLVVSMLLAASEIYADVLSLQSIKLPPGFTITVYADHVPNARGITRGQNGTLFVGTRGSRLFAIVD